MTRHNNEFDCLVLVSFRLFLTTVEGVLILVEGLVLIRVDRLVMILVSPVLTRYRQIFTSQNDRRFRREIVIHHETIFNFHMNNSVTIIENIGYQK